MAQHAAHSAVGCALWISDGTPTWVNHPPHSIRPERRPSENEWPPNLVALNKAAAANPSSRWLLALSTTSAPSHAIDQASQTLCGKRDGIVRADTRCVCMPLSASPASCCLACSLASLPAHPHSRRAGGVREWTSMIALLAHCRGRHRSRCSPAPSTDADTGSLRNGVPRSEGHVPRRNFPTTSPLQPQSCYSRAGALFIPR